MSMLQQNPRKYNIPAKSVNYGNVQFRSTLEARWAVFFSELGLDWFYEPGKYKLSPTLLYIPDFFLTIDGGLFVEVKPTKPNSLERKKMRTLCDKVGHYGVILANSLENFKKKAGNISEYYGEKSFPRRDVMMFENVKDPKSTKKFLFLSQLHEEGHNKNGWFSDSANITRAYDLALTYRF